MIPYKNIHISYQNVSTIVDMQSQYTMRHKKYNAHIPRHMFYSNPDMKVCFRIKQTFKKTNQNDRKNKIIARKCHIT